MFFINTNTRVLLLILQLDVKFLASFASYLQCNANIFAEFCYFLRFYFSISGEYVGQFKFAVLLIPNGPDKITGLLFDSSPCKKDIQVFFRDKIHQI